ncbi:MAG: nucleotidyl transferase AbiEii/AbiGii toxin family protein [Paludibacteraceae bacterium]|nr:nucleotidyl transferase AbiEii/AbiGii toxin family protein [Paludibacteraceae bacterium]
MIYTDLTAQQRLALLSQVNAMTGQYQQTIEKDWWVTQVLRVLFAQPYAEHLSFKGGTSLSKAWNLIERFSEDIDIAISREYLGFSGELSRTQVSDKLRRAACSFVREKMQDDVREGLIALGIPADQFKVHVNITSVSTTDPEIIHIEYQSILPNSEYIAHTVKVEVTGRSMHEPIQTIPLQSQIDEFLPQSNIAQPAFPVSVVRPERTFLEKVMLLHEEFAKPAAEMRTERMSRHLYDLERMLHTDIAERALNDEHLYRSVLEHRRKFIGLKGFDYDTLYPRNLSLEIPADILPAWRKDYENMRQSMIYGQSVPFDELLSEIRRLNARIRTFPYSKQ